MVKTRDTKIDLLRFIGVALVILCHAAPPRVLGALRQFDVPLLVMVSGVSFAMSYKAAPYGKYVFKRFKRLVLPVWVFLAIYIPAEDLMRFVLGKELIPAEMVLSSFALIEGVSYVWIFRVYFLMAVISPWLMKMLEKLGVRIYLTVLAVMWPLYELLTGFVLSCDGVVFDAIELVFIYAVGYGLICGVGIALRRFSRAQYIAVCAVCAALVVVMLWHDGVTADAIIKFPPRTLYIAGGLLVSLVLWRLFDLKLFDGVKNSRAVQWVSANSMWLYLWHIAPVRIYCSGALGFLEGSWVLRYIFFIAVALCLTLAQIAVKKYVEKLSGKRLPSWL